MKRIEPCDILKGYNDGQIVLDYISKNRLEDVHSSTILNITKEARIWGVVNPGTLMASAYFYLVYGYEMKLLEYKNFEESMNIFNVKYNKNVKIKYLIRRLRNSISHCKYEFFISSENERINNDGDIIIKFYDDDKGKNKIEIEVKYVDFGKFIESLGELSYNKLKK